MQETRVQPGDAVVVSYYGSGQVHVCMYRGNHGLWFRIEPDESLDYELRNALRKTIYRTLAWPFSNSDVSGIFERGSLMEALFPGFCVTGKTKPGSCNTTATFEITGVENKQQEAA